MLTLISEKIIQNRIVSHFKTNYTVIEQCVDDSRDIANGCDLPESPTIGYLHLTADGSVLYNSPYDLSLIHI